MGGDVAVLGLRQRLIILISIAIIPVLVLILYDAHEGRDTKVAKL